MARIRTIKPEFWTSDQVVECSRDARLLFIGLWNFCDDYGVMPDAPKSIKMRVFPGDDDITSEIVRRLLDELLSIGLLAKFAHANKDYLWVTGWNSHQKIDRPTRKHPAPPNGRQPKRDQSPPARRTLDERSPPEGKGKDRKGKEDNTKSESSPAASARANDDDVAGKAKNLIRLGNEILEICEIDPARWAGSFAVVQAWLNAGWSDELIILPAIRDCVRRIRATKPQWQPGTLSYFTKPIEAYAAQLDIPSGLQRPLANGGNGAAPGTQLSEEEAAKYNAAVKAWADGGMQGVMPKPADFRSAPA